MISKIITSNISWMWFYIILFNRLLSKGSNPLSKRFVRQGQRRVATKQKDWYLDLLFFHRGLRRLIAIELKLDRFEPEHKGQMEWYLRWLDKNERKEGEEKPLGIILCASKDEEDVEYLELDQAGIHVAQYLTQLPSKELMEAKLHDAIVNAKQQHEMHALNLDKPWVGSNAQDTYDEKIKNFPV